MACQITTYNSTQYPFCCPSPPAPLLQPTSPAPKASPPPAAAAATAAAAAAAPRPRLLRLGGCSSTVCSTDDHPLRPKWVRGSTTKMATGQQTPDCCWSNVNTHHQKQTCFLTRHSVRPTLGGAALHQCRACMPIGMCLQAVPQPQNTNPPHRLQNSAPALLQDCWMASHPRVR